MRKTIIESFSILVTSLPSRGISDYYGIQALPSVSQDGAYLQYRQHFYKLDFDNLTSSWQWTVMEQELKNAVYGAVMMYLPPEYRCRG